MISDRPLIGLLFVFAFCLLAPLGDALVKVVGMGAPLMVLLLSRFVFQAVSLAPVVLLSGREVPTDRRIFGLICLRSLFHILGIGMMFTALRLLPLADAIAIVFVFPFILLFLGRFVLGEEVGRDRIIACVLGFGGCLLVIKPSFAEVGIVALLPVAVAFAFSTFMLITRSIAKECDPISLQATSGGISTAMLLFVWLLVWLGAGQGAEQGAGHAAPYDLTIMLPASERIAWLLLAIGALGTAGHLCMTIALRFAPSATLAPLQYVEIPIATFLGWLFFEELPDGLAALGIMITIGAGVFVVMSERQTLSTQAAKKAETAETAETAEKSTGAASK
jgi:drug/metabolite transporter (DMT)-like permease